MRLYDIRTSSLESFNWQNATSERTKECHLAVINLLMSNRNPFRCLHKNKKICESLSPRIDFNVRCDRHPSQITEANL